MESQNETDTHILWFIGHALGLALLVPAVIFVYYHFKEESWGMPLVVFLITAWFLAQGFISTVAYWYENSKITNLNAPLFKLGDMIPKDYSEAYILRNIPWLAISLMISYFSILSPSLSNPGVRICIATWVLIMLSCLVQGAYARHRVIYYADLTQPS